MLGVMFVCHGNICRSPMAEYLFSDLVKRDGLEREFRISSSAVSREEIGSDLYPPARRVLLSHGVPCPARAARQITAEEIGEYDRILCMDESNLRLLSRISPLAATKAELLGNYGLGGEAIEDPWYTGRFDCVFEEISQCCAELLRSLCCEK